MVDETNKVVPTTHHHSPPSIAFSSFPSSSLIAMTGKDEDLPPPPLLPPPPPPGGNDDDDDNNNNNDPCPSPRVGEEAENDDDSVSTASSCEEGEWSNNTNTTNTNPSNWQEDFYTYEVQVPITEWGLQLMLQNKNNQCAIFRDYARCPDGSVGPLESRGSIRNVGDVIVSVEGTCTEELSFREVLDAIGDVLRSKEEESWDLGEVKEKVVRIGFMDGREWERRRNGEEEQVEKAKNSMELNVAYETLETMRKANLEIEFGGCVNFKNCTQCFRLKREEEANMDHTRRRRRSRKINDKHTKPCLVCGSPVCRKHCDPSFRRENKIRICSDCSPLFSHDFIMNCLDITIPDADRRRNIDRMIDAYDRTVLLLKYSAQYIDELANALQKNTRRNNGVSLGTGTASVASSVAGAVGLVTIFTPLGPHLLIASLLFSGSATAVQTGSEAVNYFAEPNKVANKIIALHAMMRSILSVTDVLREALQREQVRIEPYLKGGSVKSGAEDVDGSKMANDGKKAAALAGGAAIVAARNTRFVTRASATVMRSARVALAAGGALTAASIVLETMEISRVINKMSKGNPCQKADLIREIKKEVEDLPDTRTVGEEVEKYFDMMVAKPVEAAALQDKNEEEEKEGGDALDQHDMLDAIKCLEMNTAMGGMVEHQPEQGGETPLVT